jgi:hypothetical protein
MGLNLALLPLGVLSSLLFGYACAAIVTVLLPLVIAKENAQATAVDMIAGVFGFGPASPSPPIDELGMAAIPWCMALGMHLVVERTLAQRQPWGSPATTWGRVGWGIGMLLFICSGFALLDA